ncbi:hypothetical protein Noc_0550 [Nitrosococcus oceani ATCC 19707]|uniref:Hydrazine synthase alpha subunit middle domain-containing protein n=2 Tax=Nitrosococcus oceani TaxID=1229 RepID=Q3JDM6_NITOC|nr:hypothetical protein [Nitrosococcus oceani]ABA57070.1 hypothetical protein Noc_0550 [Nitrosococcus oceani ATCC 19707]EDZ66360.1 hypothetical protein NOC27_3040 [Nitrosococcus oceani AFC27]KFI20478.1 hypothetical protein IB75_02890 [Nitrosococcus oceani C-27]GEM19915.1 hypothetical protein NONS58_13150 [Nitrosococcus oceani]
MKKTFCLLAIVAFPAMAEVTVTEPTKLTSIESQISAQESKSLDLKARSSALEAEEHLAAAIDGFVYARVKRTTGNFVVKGKTYHSISATDRLIDVTFQGTTGDFLTGPGDLVWRKGDGTEVILHHCPEVALGENTCIVIDPRVSFDGKQVAYTVLEGRYGTNPDVKMQHGIDAQKSSLHFVNLETMEKTQWAAVQGVFDMAPQWLPDGTLMFTSNRDHIKAGSISGFSPEGEVLQLWVADRNGSHARNVSPDILADALHPILHPSGKVLFSSWKRDLESVQNKTLDNLWYIAETRQDGSEHNAIWGAHARFLPNPDNITIKALHFTGVRSNGDVCTTNYYRQNNKGGGNIQCFTYPTPNHPEGKFPFKAKEGRYLGLWGHSGDQFKTDGLGRTRDPMGMPKGGLVFSASPKGVCHFFHKIAQLPLNDSGCDFGIYVQGTVPEKSLESRILIVNSPDWHEFQPQPVMPYEDIYGIKKPPVVKMDHPNPDGKCILRSASKRMQVDNEQGYRGPGNANPCYEQGCSMAGVDKQALMTSIKFWRPVPFNSRVLHQDFDGFGPFRMEVLGTVPLRSDGSFTAEVPCDTPFYMAGVDSEGRTLARDKIAMSLRPGETRTCSGCHNHDDDNPPQFKDSEAAKVAPTPVPASGTLLNWTTDVWPLLRDNCDENFPEFNLSASTEEKAFNNFTHYAKGAAKPPWRSYFINWLFARESLLYWRSAGERLDGRTDASRTDDIDYGTVAPKQACLNAAQLKILADWIESGAYRKNNKW